MPLTPEEIAAQAPPPETPPSEPAPPATPPAGTVQLTQEEFNRLQADSRVARKKAEKLEKDQRDREEAERLEAQKAAGEFDAALRDKDEKLRKAERANELRDVRDALRDRISAMGFAGSKAAGLLKLVSVEAIMVTDGAPDRVSVDTEVEATIAAYPDLFTPGTTEEPENEETPRMRRNAPAPAQPPTQGSEPSDYISPAEYLSTSHAVRHSEAFQERVKNSRPYWPKKITASSFAVDQ